MGERALTYILNQCNQKRVLCEKEHVLCDKERVLCEKNTSSGKKNASRIHEAENVL